VPTNSGSEPGSPTAGTRSFIIKLNKSYGTRINLPHFTLPKTYNLGNRRVEWGSGEPHNGAGIKAHSGLNSDIELGSKSIGASTQRSRP